MGCGCCGAKYKRRAASSRRGSPLSMPKRGVPTTPRAKAVKAVATPEPPKEPADESK